ncbi:MAG TPA: hypothetical protein VFR81_23760, partial [Longimicrobium sp.]|nr:hypothetical protein [Longimicrobium sp.]
LAAIPASEAVDVLVVSAYPGDYYPLPGALIDALHRKGISLAELAREKEDDLREAFGCWISKDISREHPRAGFRRVLCFEPQILGRRAAAVMGLIFRTIAATGPFEPPIRSVATPIPASGYQGHDPDTMLEALLDAAVPWMERGIPLDVIKIVVYSAEELEFVRPVFAYEKARLAGADPHRLTLSEIKAGARIFIGMLEIKPRSVMVGRARRRRRTAAAV